MVSKKKVKEWAINQLKNEVDKRDLEEAHYNADYILCQVLEKLGLEEVVEIYNKIGKWYA